MEIQMKKNLKQYIKPVLVSVLFGMLNALSCRLFIVPNGFASSGVEGISVMINRITGFNLAYIQLIFNVPLCIFAFFCVDKKFSVFTVIYSLIYSLSYLVFDNMDFLTRFEYKALGEDTIYPVLVAGVVSGAAYGFLFKENSSSGGVDIMSRYINKRNPRFNFFYVTFTINAIIAIASYFVFVTEVDGQLVYSYRPVCMCVLCDFISNFIGDMIIKGRESAYRFFVVSDNVSAIEREIALNLVHTSTRFECYGSYTNEKKGGLMCIVTREEIIEFERILKNHPDCFAYEMTVNKVIGYFDKK